MQFTIKETGEIRAVEFTNPKQETKLKKFLYARSFIQYFGLVEKLGMEINPAHDDDAIFTAPKYIISQDSFAAFESLVLKINAFDRFRYFTAQTFGEDVYSVTCASKIKIKDVEGYIHAATRALNEYLDNLEIEAERNACLSAVA